MTIPSPQPGHHVVGSQSARSMSRTVTETWTVVLLIAPCVPFGGSIPSAAPSFPHTIRAAGEAG